MGSKDDNILTWNESLDEEQEPIQLDLGDVLTWDALNDENHILIELGIYSNDDWINGFTKQIYNAETNYSQEVLLDMPFADYIVKQFIKNKNVESCLSEKVKQMKKISKKEILSLFQYNEKIEDMPFLNLGLSDVEKLYLISEYIQKLDNERNIYVGETYVQDNYDFQNFIVILFGISTNDGQCKLNIQRILEIDEITLRVLLDTFPQIKKAMCNYKDKQGKILLNSIFSDRTILQSIIMDSAASDSIYDIVECNVFKDDELLDIIFEIKVDLDDLLNSECLISRP